MTIKIRSTIKYGARILQPPGLPLFTMLAGYAKFERELICARKGEGRKRAKPRGVKFGPPPKLSVPTNARRRSSGLLRARRRRISRGPTA